MPEDGYVSADWNEQQTEHLQMKDSPENLP
jgi:hypothetical protein